MNEPIKLTEDNIDITSSVYGHFVQIQFRLDEKEKAKQLKQQILKNQKNVKIKNQILQENKQLKNKLKKIRDHLKLKQSEGYGYVNNYDFEEILGDNN